MFTNRYYQDDAIEAGLATDNGILVLPTGAGKSLVCAGLVNNRRVGSLVLQPSKEILESNFEKARAYGLKASIYSASVGQKDISDITYATIGSIIKKLDLFADFENLLIDECHLVNAKGGMYEKLISTIPFSKLIGMSATPYRLQTNSYGSHMKILNRTRPKIFRDISYVINPRELVTEGYLLEPEFINVDADHSMLRPNTTGAEFSEQSMKRFIKKNDTVGKMIQLVIDVQKEHNHILVFTESIEASDRMVAVLNQCGVTAACVTAKTPKKERAAYLQAFQSGHIKAMMNVGTLTVGYDFPALDCIIDGGPTMSAAKHYQKTGREVRPFEGKNPFFYDMCGNYRRLGNPLNYTMTKNSTGLWEVYSERGRITTRAMDQRGECETYIDFGKYRGKKLCDVDDGYLEWGVSEFKGEKKHMFFSEMKRRELFGVEA